MDWTDTEIVFLIDKSGSMYGLEEDTIRGFNSMIEKQKKESGECMVTTILFNHEISMLYDRVKINDVPTMQAEDYVVSGCTALLDAIGFGIKHIELAQAARRMRKKPTRTLFVITTDGMENASQKYTAEQVKRMVKKKQKKNWEFLFLGANIDTVSTAKGIGIDANRAASFVNDSKGVAANYEAISEAICAFRDKKEYEEIWKTKIEKDYCDRIVEI